MRLKIFNITIVHVRINNRGFTFGEIHFIVETDIIDLNEK